MSKIIGNTTTTPVPRSNWVQTDENKADYILNKPELGALAAKDVVEKNDLAEDIKASLEKADSAIQTLDGYATESYVDEALESKADVAHDHDDKYYTQAQVDESLSRKSQVQIVTVNETESITNDLLTLKIHKLTQEQYDEAVQAGNIDENALYLTPDEEIDLSGYATIDQLDGKADATHEHDIDEISSLQSALDSNLEAAKEYANGVVSSKADSTHNHDGAYDANGSANTALESAKDYTDQEIAKLLNNSSEAVDSIYELRDAMADNADAIEALNTIATGKADASHSHEVADVSGLQAVLDSKVGVDVFNALTAEDVGAALAVHNHDDVYYTETEIDAKLAAKADASAIPSALSDLTDDSAHRTVSDEEKASWNAKTNFSGSYNDLTDKPTDLTTKAYVDGQISSTKSYVDGIKEEVDGITAELGESITQNSDAIGELETAVAGKADASHDHSALYYLKSEIDAYLAQKAQIQIIKWEEND